MTTKKLYIFRHGETDWNRAKRLQGHSDTELNSLGLEQARALKPLIDKIDPQLILSSDLKRALNTAKIACEGLLNKKPPARLIITPELREADLGEVEGLERDFIIKKYGHDVLEQWFNPDLEDFAFPGGETKKAHSLRLAQAIEKYMTEFFDAEKIAISTHGGSVHRLIHMCINRPQEPLWIDNGTLFEIEVQLEKQQWLFVREIR